MTNEEILKTPFFFRQKGIHRYYSDIEVLEAMNKSRKDERDKVLKQLHMKLQKKRLTVQIRMMIANNEFRDKNGYWLRYNEVDELIKTLLQ